MSRVFQQGTPKTKTLRAMSMSVLTATPVTFALMYALISIWSRLGEDVLVLFLLLGIPSFMATSFVVVIYMYSTLLARDYPTKSLITGWMMAFVISFILQEASMYITSFYQWSEYMTKWAILLGTWIPTISISTIWFLLLRQRRYGAKT